MSKLFPPRPKGVRLRCGRNRCSKKDLETRILMLGWSVGPHVQAAQSKVLSRLVLGLGSPGCLGCCESSCRVSGLDSATSQRCGLKSYSKVEPLGGEDEEVSISGCGMGCSEPGAIVSRSDFLIRPPLRTSDAVLRCSPRLSVWCSA